MTNASDAYQALLDGRGDAFSTDNTEVLAWAPETKDTKLELLHLVIQILLHQRFKKETKNSLDFINDDIQKLGKENFLPQSLRKTLHPTYGDAAKADDLVVEGGEVK